METISPIFWEQNKFIGNRSQLRQWRCWEAVFALRLLMLGAARSSWVSLGVPARQGPHRREKVSGQGTFVFMCQGYFMYLFHWCNSLAPFPPLFFKLLLPLYSKPQLLRKNELSPIHSNSEGSQSLLWLSYHKHYNWCCLLGVFSFKSSRSSSVEDNKHMLTSTRWTTGWGIRITRHC